MISVTEEEGELCPIILCDGCDERITESDDSVCLYPFGKTEDEIVSVKHAHKGVCHDQVEETLKQRVEEGSVHWRITERFLDDLVHNSLSTDLARK